MERWLTPSSSDHDSASLLRRSILVRNPTQFYLPIGHVVIQTPLADRLLPCDLEAVEECVCFTEGDSMGIWHGSARAMMSRRLKHCKLTPGQRSRLVRAILARLVSGRFSEQFKDQIRLALHLDCESVFRTAAACKETGPEHVRRYAKWILAHGSSAR